MAIPAPSTKEENFSMIFYKVNGATILALTTKFISRFEAISKAVFNLVGKYYADKKHNCSDKSKEPFSLCIFEKIKASYEDKYGTPHKE